MSSDVVILAEGLGKKYVIGHQAEREVNATLRDTIVRNVRNWGRSARDMMRGQALVAGDESEDFWALKDINFEIKRGEVVGIIGRNGAGKSTLLKVLSRITEPTKGRVTIDGRVASLLEVGTGFHPELTGRENIYLNGAILGMSRAEIKRKFDEIVDFAGVEKFLDTPVKRYSSGMYVRLAFAVAAHLEPEILIVDEVLAVGDAEFQKKCLSKMKDVAGHGRTVLFVSHNLQSVKLLCKRAILLHKGGVQKIAETTSVLKAYGATGSTVNVNKWIRNVNEDYKNTVFFEIVNINLHGTQPNINLVCNIKIKIIRESPSTFVAIDIADQLGSPIMQALPSIIPFISGKVGQECFLIKVELPPLIPGIYKVDFWLGSHNTNTIDSVIDKLTFEITDSPTKGRLFPHTSDHGLIVPNSSYASSEMDF